MRALVIGATGIIGNHVVRSLLEQQIEVRCFSRGLTPSINLEGLDVERQSGDLNDTSSLSRAIRGCSWIFHTAPYYPLNMFDLAGHVRSAMEGIGKVLQVCAQHSIDRFVYTSSLTTIGKPKEGGLANETCAYDLAGRPPHPYFELKYLMEEEVRRVAKEEKFPAVMVNPTGCFGPYEMKPPNLCLIPQLLKGRIPVIVDRPMNIVDVADVGRGHVLAAQKGIVGERYILGGPNVATRWLLETICRLGGRRPPQISLPLSLALIPPYLAEWGARLMGKKVSPISILGLRFLQYGQHFSLQKAEKELGYRCSNMEPCLERAIGWFKKIGYC